MSRIGLQPITIPSGVAIDVSTGLVSVKGPKGELKQRVHPEMIFSRENGTMSVARPNDERMFRQLHGLTRTLVNNMVVGVTNGYRKDLEIQGVGYRAALEGTTLVLNVGYSHQVRMDPPAEIQFVVDTPTRLAVTGIDKQLVGEVAAKLRGVRPPEPYKGKGIRYQGEQVRRKAGKAGKVGK
ncbi:MAG: 50S ribosomal protein L6 [Chloroflexota bacterium]|nr:50S ribosomal protein L6 [Chloroflexota bacterium]